MYAYVYIVILYVRVVMSIYIYIYIYIYTHICCLSADLVGDALRVHEVLQGVEVGRTDLECVTRNTSGVCLCMCVCIMLPYYNSINICAYIYIYIERERCIGWHYLSDATCLVRPRLFLRAFRHLGNLR